MKKLLFFIATITLLTSCLDLRFAQTMPASATAIPAFPENLRGTYVGKHNKDTMRVSIDSIDVAAIRLGENNVLKPFGKYYVLNTKKNDRWNVAIIKPCGKKTLKLYSFDIADGKKRKALNAISTLQEVYDEEGSVDYVSTNPTDAEFEKMIKSKGLIEIDHFKKIKP